MPIDYVAELGATVRSEANGTRFLCGEANAIFVGHAPDEITTAINRSMRVTVEYYTLNVSRSSTRISEALIRDASLGVVVDCLYGRSYRRERLEVDLSDLESTFMRGHLLWFCKKTFGTHYRDFAAVLMGLSASEFDRWEEGWDRYVNK